MRLHLKNYCPLRYITLVGGQINVDMADRIVPREKEHQMRNDFRSNSVFELECEDFLPQIIIDRAQQTLCELG